MSQNSTPPIVYQRRKHSKNIALKTDTNDASECSFSGALTAVPPEISERDKFSNILRSQGLLDEVSTRKNGASTESNRVSRKKYCSKSCKVCGHKNSTSNMLICDKCEDRFHVSCYNPHIARIPVTEWLCSSCSELDFGSLEFMLRDTEQRMSNVRIGSDFQADVPDWSGPVTEECDLNGEPLKAMDSNFNQPQRLPSIGNWLQCRAVIEGNEKICGKWRRAPLYAVQTDKWECFSCVLWDPVHADCAVPQELPTDEVKKQLKYAEMSRPRLPAKRRKLDTSKSNGSQGQRKAQKLEKMLR